MLLKKLDACGIRGVAYELFKDYLSNRISFVRINAHLSKPQQLKFGIPQGTILGPQLFLIYMNDLLKINVNGDIISYADDTVLLFAEDTWEHVKSKSEIGLYKIKCWLDMNLLSLNFQKTKFVTFSNSTVSQPTFSTITYHTKCRINECCCKREIGKTDNIKYLGLIINNTLKWDNHSQYLTNRLRKFVYTFYELRKFLPIEILKIAYKALVESILSYGIVVWGGTYESQIKTLILTQKWILKVITSKPKRFPTSQLFSNSWMMDMRQLYIFNVSKFMYQNKMTTIKNAHVYYTRQRQNLQIPQVNTTLFQKFICTTGPKIYNCIPEELKNLRNFRLFSKKLKQLIISNKDLFQIT